MSVLQTLITLLIYPGLLLALVLSVLYTMLTKGWMAQQPGVSVAPRDSQVLRNLDGALNIASMVFAGLGLMLLPWPLHQLAPGPSLWLWSWALFEIAFVIVLLPGLLSGWPPLVRAAMRELQIGVVGRALLWTALTVGLFLRTDWSLTSLPAHVLAILAAICAFPAAVGWGPFAAETSLVLGAANQGLDSATTALVHRARDTRTAILLGGSLVALLPLALMSYWIALWLIGLAFVLAGTTLNRLNGVFPRMTLPSALQFCWWRALPLSAAAILYLALVGDR
ncbi:MAG: hypothetical protein MI924_13535 [Chloroflexales bacterium]|nr:hypothetical protein [Chloroflexales bacterium]